jgi:hypothetical protein
MRTTRISGWRDDSPTAYARNRGLGRVTDNGDRRLRDTRIQGSDPRAGQSSGTAGTRGTTRRVIDDAELRRLRSGGSTRSDIRANADTPRERSLAEAYRRPRMTDGRVTRDVGDRNSRAQDTSRFARFDPNARSNRGEPSRAGNAPQMRTSPSAFGRVAATQRAPTTSRRAPATSRPAQSREQPTSWPGTRSARPSAGQAERRTPNGGAVHAQPGTRAMLRDAGGGRSGGRLQIGDRGQRRR